VCNRNKQKAGSVVRDAMHDNRDERVKNQPSALLRSPTFACSGFRGSRATRASAWTRVGRLRGHGVGRFDLRGFLVFGGHSASLGEKQFRRTVRDVLNEVVISSGNKDRATSAEYVRCFVDLEGDGAFDDVEDLFGR